MQNQVGGRRARRSEATAEETWQVLERHGLIDSSDTTVIGGFTLLHGHGDCPPAQTLCSIAASPDWLLIVAEVGARGRVFVPYRELLGLETGGQGVVTSNWGMIGGGVGVRGLAAGVAKAALINNATTKTAIDSYLRVSSERTEMLFSQWKLPPAAVRAGLGRAFVAQMAHQRAAVRAVPPAPAPGATAVPARSALDELEQLTRLHAAGTLTDSEFQAARDRQVQRLQQES